MKLFLVLFTFLSLKVSAQEIPGDYIEYHLKDDQIEKVEVKKTKKKKIEVTIHMKDLAIKDMISVAQKNPGKEIKVFSRKRFLEKFRLSADSPKLKAFHSLENWRSESEVTKVFDKLPTVFIP